MIRLRLALNLFSCRLFNQPGVVSIHNCCQFFGKVYSSPAIAASSRINVFPSRSQFPDVLHQPTRGQMMMDGQEVRFPRPRDAQEMGIATVHQFGGTYPLMSVGRNFFAGAEPTKGFGPFKVFDRQKANQIAVEEVQKMGITRITDGDRLVGGLSGGERQSLAIARAVYFGARVLILDEPTAALGVKQAAHVLRIVNEAKRRGLAVIFITHQVMHAMAVGDHFAVLIRGAIAADFRKGEKSREEIADLMAGGESMADLEANIDGMADA